MLDRRRRGGTHNLVNALPTLQEHIGRGAKGEKQIHTILT